MGPGLDNASVDGDDELARAIVALIRAASDPKRRRRMIDLIDRARAAGDDEPSAPLRDDDAVRALARSNLERRGYRTRKS